MIEPDDDLVLSPCISICKMDPRAGTDSERAAGGLCVGCSRTIDEIIEWSRSTAGRKREILAAVDLRRR